MKKRTKKNMLISLIIVSTILLIISLVLIFTSDKNKLSFVEKSWISDNKNSVIDITVDDELPVFSLKGTGVYYDFITDFQDDSGLSFNITYNHASIVSLHEKTSLESTDILFYKDHYAIISKENIKYSNISNIYSKRIGILSKDKDLINLNISNISEENLKGYETITDIINAFEQSEIDIVIVPIIKSLDLILTDGYYINYHLDGINSYYVATVDSTNDTLKQIMNKFFNKWQDEFNDEYNENLVNIIYDSEELTEIEKDSITNKNIIVGYIDNLPYEGLVKNKFIGFTGGYLKGFSNLTGATYKYKKFDNLKAVSKALNDKSIDIFLNYYSIDNANYTSSLSLGNVDVVVLASKTNDLVVNSLNSLKGYDISVIQEMNLSKYLKSINGINVLEFESSKKLLNNIDDNSIIVVEKEFYDFYKNDKLKNYNIRYLVSLNLENKFLFNSNNTVFNKVFNIYLPLTSSNEMAIKSLNDSLIDYHASPFLQFITNNVFYLIISLIILMFSFYKLSSRITISKRIKKEDRLLYLDVMTNLKNRNYLNDNIAYWSENIVYPQAIVMFDLNDIRVINDKKGHEAGDAQIKAAASVLIKSQRENSEIIRTDGNEFLIYLVGYEEKIVTAYIHKLAKELKNNLPYDYGVSFGYSMIKDELKSIDDAINETLIIVRKNKEEQKKSEESKEYN